MEDEKVQVEHCLLMEDEKVQVEHCLLMNDELVQVEHCLLLKDPKVQIEHCLLTKTFELKGTGKDTAYFIQLCHHYNVYNSHACKNLRHKNLKMEMKLQNTKL